MIMLIMLEDLRRRENGNFNIQNSDLILVMGARMHVRQIGFNHESLLEMPKTMIDIDKSELDKFNLNMI